MRRSTGRNVKVFLVIVLWVLVILLGTHALVTLLPPFLRSSGIVAEQQGVTTYVNSFSCMPQEPIPPSSGVNGYASFDFTELRFNGGVVRFSPQDASASVINSDSFTVRSVFTLHPTGAANLSHCGLFYCQGQGCSPTVALTATFENLTRVYDARYCFFEAGCSGPSEVTKTYSISGESPILVNGSSYSFSLYIEDLTGHVAYQNFTVIYKERS